MSTLIVEVREVSRIERHPYADRLVIATIGGWKTCIGFNPETGKSELKVGEKCVYFPPDSVMPVELSDRFGITKYLAPIKNPDGSSPPRYRVRAARLRGVASYGFVIPIRDNPDWKVGDNVVEFYGITKYEPPPESLDEDSLAPHPAFHGYTEIENWRNFPDVFQDDEEVVVTEKIHGKCCRIGLIRVDDEGGGSRWETMCGSHDARRKEIDSQGQPSDFWKPLTGELKALLQYLSRGERNVIAFCEIYGAGIQSPQDMHYGLEGKECGYRIFDISVDGQYLDYDEKAEVCRQFGVEMVPVLYRGPYSARIVEELTDGPTTMCPQDRAGRFRGREGVVITPVKERLAVTQSLVSRAILKSVSADYLARKGGTDSH